MNKQFFTDLMAQLETDGFTYLHFENEILYVRKDQQLVLFEAPTKSSSAIDAEFLANTKGHRGIATATPAGIQYRVERNENYESQNGRVELSQWELRDLGLRVALKKLEVKGFEFLQIHSVPNELTQVVAVKDLKQYLFVCETTLKHETHATYLTNEQWSDVLVFSQAGEMILAHARIFIASSEDPFDPQKAAEKFPIYRGDGYLPKIEFSLVKVSDGELEFVELE